MRSALRVLLEKPWVVLVVALVIQVVTLLAMRADVLASDPLWYASIAHGISIDPRGALSGTEAHPFVMRIGLTFPLGLLYRVFGVTPFVSCVPALLAGLGVMLVAYAAATTARAKLLAILFVATSTPLIAHGTTVGVDLPCAALLGVAVLCMSRRDRGRFWLVAGVLSWFSAFLVKEIAVWLLPVWLYAIAVDTRGIGRSAVARRYGPALLTAVALTLSYLAWCHHLWGTPWARLSGIDELTVQHAWALTGRPEGDWVKRLVWRPPLLFVEMLKVAVVPLVLAPWLLSKRDRIWLIASASIALCYWFGSSSFSAYSPLPIMQRMALPLLPVALSTAAIATDGLLSRMRTNGQRTMFTVALVLCLLTPSIQAVRRLAASPHPEALAYESLRTEAASASALVLLCADPRCPAISEFHFGFQLPPNLHVLQVGDLPAVDIPADAVVRIVINRKRRATASVALLRTVDAAALPVLFKSGHIEVYDAKDVSTMKTLLEQSGQSSSAGNATP